MHGVTMKIKKNISMNFWYNEECVFFNKVEHKKHSVINNISPIFNPFEIICNNMVHPDRPHKPV